jgi:hypothetical protein
MSRQSSPLHNSLSLWTDRMGIFNKFRSSSERVPSSPTQTEMTDYTESSHSGHHSRDSSRLLSSGSSIMSQSTAQSAQSSYSSRKIEKGWVNDINKHSLMAKHLHRNCKKNNWLEEKANEACVALRTFQGEYILYPPEDPAGVYQKAVKGLNVEVRNSLAYLTLGLYPDKLGCGQSNHEQHSPQHIRRSSPR